MEIKRYDVVTYPKDVLFGGNPEFNALEENPEGNLCHYEDVRHYLEPQPIENAPTSRQIIAYCLREDGTWAFVGAGWVVNGKFPVRTWEDIATHYLEFPLPLEVKR